MADHSPGEPTAKPGPVAGGGAGPAQLLQTWFAAGPQPQATPFPQLTEREREILDGVAAGLSNAQIG
jgi:DNA-binding NarL/FixJ family response regulator